MTTLRWPLALPQTLPPGTTLTPQKNFVETEMDAGPPKRRTRFTAVSRFLEVSGDLSIYTTAQWDVLETFHRETLGGGALSFLWESPIPGLGDVECRFRGDPPKASILRGANGRLVYRVAFQLEVLP